MITPDKPTVDAIAEWLAFLDSEFVAMAKDSKKPAEAAEFRHHAKAAKLTRKALLNGEPFSRYRETPRP